MPRALLIPVGIGIPVEVHESDICHEVYAIAMDGKIVVVVPPGKREEAERCLLEIVQRLALAQMEPQGQVS
jgi:hypothetical protein